MKVSIVIPNWNGEDFLADCLDALLKQSQKCSIVVVENGSVDSSDEILASYGNKITVLKQPKNLGFDGGVNVGIRFAQKHKSDYIALLNNDAIVPPNWLKSLVGVLNADDSVGIVTSKILHFDENRLDSTGDFYTIYGLPFPRGRNEIDKGQYDNSIEIFGASGGASLYRAKMFEEIGIFDEDFFAYYEDVEISFRAQLRGWKVRYQPKAEVRHHISGTSNKISGFATYHCAKNFWFTYVKNMPALLFWKYLPFASYWYCRMFAARLVKGGLWPFFKGWVAGLALLPKKFGERLKIQKNRTVSAKHIDSIIAHHRPPKINF